MRSNQMYVRQFIEEMDLDGVDVESIFMKMHKGKDQKSQPIVSMGDDHLINTIRLNLVKKPNVRLMKLEEQIKVDLLQGYAPSDMPDNVRISLGLKKISAEKEAAVREKVEQVLETAKSALLNKALQMTMPYIVVAVTRESTLLGVRAILVEATGIDVRIDLPEYTSYGILSEQEVLELTGGHPLEDNSGHMHPDWEDMDEPFQP